MAHRDDHDVVDSQVEHLLTAARAAASRAYAPYSSFPVGAAVLTSDETIVAGANIENASYGLTVCGERVAVFQAVAAGHHEIVAVAVSAPKAPGATPCGACRQVLNEFKPSGQDLVVLLDHGPDSNPSRVRLSALLPDAFGPHDLKVSGDTGFA